MSDEEMEALEQVAMHRRVNTDEDDQVFWDEDSSPADRGGGVPIFRWDDNYRFGEDDFDNPTTNVHDIAP